ncbi:MAG: methyl-accepting chemotaxis protein [Sphingomonadales bacterium]|nr:methyl-accepting chemotaxis protein [Sphingomonadales bacterium]
MELRDASMADGFRDKDGTLLQKLTDGQVANRLRAYNDDGGFERELGWLWAEAGDLIEAAVRASGGDSAARRTRDSFTRPVDAAWIHAVAGLGFEIYTKALSVPAEMDRRARLVASLGADFAGRFDDQGFRRALEALQRLAAYESDIILAQLALLEANEAAAARGRRSEQFERNVAALVEATTGESAKLRDKTGQTAASARGMLGKTSEVASAAEQSALAMRDAAETAAGLIRAIEEARAEVEVAAGVAVRAGEEASGAMRASQALSAHVEAIESILGLIRDIAGQTNLLALNATIEAARAGDAGRGFAVVAQEVKSLAAQTARATDDITAKITAIQQATKQTVDANGSIQKTVEDVQTSADRIREAMEVQAQTVTMITAAVDETALAADSMSATIAAIRRDTEGVASEIDAVESGFANVDDRLTRFRTAASEFLTGFAA